MSRPRSDAMRTRLKENPEAEARYCQAKAKDVA